MIRLVCRCKICGAPVDCGEELCPMCESTELTKIIAEFCLNCPHRLRRIQKLQAEPRTPATIHFTPEGGYQELR